MPLVPDHIWATMTIWAEARGEPWEGKVAVAEVIRNRTKVRHCSNGSVGSTVLWSYQFSCWNASEKQRIRYPGLEFSDSLVDECLRAWNHSQEGSSITQGALYYLNPDAVVKIPDWVAKCDEIIKINRHVFYKPK